MIKKTIYLTLFVILFAFICCSIASCKKPQPAEVNFYFWKTAFKDTSITKKVIQEYGTHKIYLRLYDIATVNGIVKPIGMINFSERPINKLEYIPTIFIKNNVFDNIPTQDRIEDLAVKTSRLTQEIMSSQSLKFNEIQIDCDWTLTTKESFFLYVTYLKKLCPNIKVSVTLRLHQIKYKEKTGIPPADKFVLMYYNIGQLDKLKENSIYNYQTASQYVKYLDQFPYPLSIALPIYSWEVHTRSGKAIGLRSVNILNLSANNIRKKYGNNYEVISSIFENGIYYRQGDIIKLEEISIKDLETMAKQLRKNYSKSFQEVILFHLDSLCISRYNKSEIISVINNMSQ
jgi:hypothetical protein